MPNCRFCERALTTEFCDLGMSPLANSYLKVGQGNAMEPFYPLRVLVCDACFLVQLEAYESPSHIFSDYAYFSSYSSSWLAHARAYTEKMVDRLALDEGSKVVEVASNDGYLLQYFAQRGIPVLGIEPAANVAEVAEAAGVPTLVEFFGRETARQVAQDGQADLVLGNNVLAHVPDLNDFVGGLKLLLAPGGTITIEFPHLLRLVEENQFDTIYHEHFSYFSFLTVTKVFEHHGMRLFDVEELPTHGGSLRIYGCHADDPRPRSEAADELLERERGLGYEDIDVYREFGERVRADKRAILSFLIELKDAGSSIVGYGAAAKGNTLLNYCGIRGDFLDYVVDANPHKQDHLLPGTHIPVRSPDALRETRPDYVLILPWNIRDEVMEEHAYIEEWGGRFIARSPQLAVLT